ncbi:MAG: hypothetical protein ACXW3G_13840, partial [Rhodoplanes sp.]
MGAIGNVVPVSFRAAQPECGGVVMTKLKVPSQYIFQLRDFLLGWAPYAHNALRKSPHENGESIRIRTCYESCHA